MKLRMHLSYQTFLSKFTGLQNRYYEELTDSLSQTLKTKDCQPKNGYVL
jgi:hypothetical protein